MNRPAALLPLSIAAVLLLAPQLHAESTVVVVMNASSSVDMLTREQVVNIFLGRFRQLPNGLTAVPVDQPAELPLRELFYKRLVNKSQAEIQAYWARLIFSGRTAPPQQAKTGVEVLQQLADNPAAVAYFESGPLPPEVKVVLDLGPLP